MTREMLVRVATATLNKLEDAQAAQKAEAIAAQLDMFAEVMGDAPAQRAAVVSAMPTAPAFPAHNPQSVIVEAPPRQEYWQDIDGSRGDTQAYTPNAPGNLIIPAATIPDSAMLPDPGRIGKVAQQPPRSLRQASNTSAPGRRLSVTELNLLVQERTPQRLDFEVPMDDGSTRRMMFERNVLSRHGFDSVTLLYFPPGTPTAGQEATEVQQVIHVDDLPLNLTGIINSLKAQAIQACRPKGQVVSQTPRINLGAVKHPSDSYEDPNTNDMLQKQGAIVGAVFGTIG